jgi:hypothetical protein
VRGRSPRIGFPGRFPSKTELTPLPPSFPRPHLDVDLVTPTYTLRFSSHPANLNPDAFFGNVCELDLVFNFYKVYAILDEVFLAGEVEETSKQVILERLEFLEKLE